jgi:hypothetical protein
VYNAAAVFLRLRRQEQHDELMCYEKLRRLKLLANYGDLVGYQLQKIRADLKVVAVATEVLMCERQSLSFAQTWVIDDPRKANGRSTPSNWLVTVSGARTLARKPHAG